ncbi:hypothetical protein Tco_0242511 [Tanacetum coccineum]
MAEAEIAHESSLKRAREELEQESSKKQKLEEDKESEELKQCLEIIPDDGDDVTINATPLSTKSPTIVIQDLQRRKEKLFPNYQSRCSKLISNFFKLFAKSVLFEADRTIEFSYSAKREMSLKKG